jgi:hypothetical protein
MTMLRKTGSVLIAVATAVGLGLTPVSASAAPVDERYCGIQWGSGPKTATPATAGYLTDIRAGEQPCYDRLVFDIGQSRPQGFFVSYVDEIKEDASGETIPVRGGAKLQITIYAPAYDQSNQATYSYENRNELVDVTDYRTFRQIVWAGSWEGTTMTGLGVRERLPFRVFTRDNAVVVDVAHKW